MDADDALNHWDEHGFVVLPAFVGTEDLGPGVSELGILFPTADEFHNDPDDPRNAAFRGDEYGGLLTIPFASVELSLLAVHPSTVGLARTLLRTEDIRIYSAEAWAKFTGACDYAQEHHRDYLNHTVVVPSNDPSRRNLEMFLFLNGVSEELGPTHLVSTELTSHLPLMPHCFPQADYPDLYRAEMSGAGPAGTVVAYRGETLHRATDLTAPGGARYTLHCSFRPAADEWVGRQGWGDRSFDPSWTPFVLRATVEQLCLFGFPPPGHAFWTPETRHGLAVRYPGIDVGPWKSGV